MKKLLFSLVALGLGFTQLSAQDKKDKGRLTFAADLSIGAPVIGQPQVLQHEYQEKLGGEGAISLLYHIPEIRSQVGIGFSAQGYGDPYSYRAAGIHLDYKYHLSKKLRPLVLHGRLGWALNRNESPNQGRFTNTSSDVVYNPNKLYGSLALGWEFSRLLGPIGFAPSVGVTYTGLKYNFPGDKSGSSNQAMLFFRLALLIN